MQRRPFAFPHINGSPIYLETYHQSDVGPLSCRVTFKPVSTPLQRDLRFFAISHSRTPNNVPCGSPAQSARVRGYHVPLI